MSDRSRSPRRDKDRSSLHRSSKDKDRRRSRSRSPRREVDLQREFGVDEISEDDYFLKSAEFRLWLKEEKGKYLDQLLGDDARHYFRKFVKAWNRGKLARTFYAPTTSSSRPSASQTSYKWAFAKNGVRIDSRALDSARAAVDAMTNGASPAEAASSSSSSSSRPMAGPSMGPAMGPSMGPSMGPPVMGAQRPTAADRTFDHESRKERSRDDDKRERKRAREEEKEGRSSGREGRLEKRKEVNASNRAMRDRSPGGLEADEGTLLGGPTNEFQAQIAARDRNAARHEERRKQEAEARKQAVGAQTSAMAQRNNATMDMFKQMAAQKYGGGGN